MRFAIIICVDRPIYSYSRISVYNLRRRRGDALVVPATNTTQPPTPRTHPPYRDWSLQYVQCSAMQEPEWGTAET